MHQQKMPVPWLPQRMQQLRSSSPGHTASTGITSCARVPCCAMQQNSTEMKQRKLLHALWFQPIKKRKAGRGRILLFAHLSSLQQFLSLTAILKVFRCKTDLRINVLKKDILFPKVIFFYFQLVFMLSWMWKVIFRVKSKYEFSL